MPESPAPEHASHYPRALLGVYVRAALWFLGLVALLWMLGFEAIHGHPTPFYALIAPIGLAWNELLWALGAGLVAVALLYLVVANLKHLMRPNATVTFDASDPESPEKRRQITDQYLTKAMWVHDVPAVNWSRRQLLLLIVFAALFPVCVAMMRGGPDGISQAYARQSYEYIGDIGKTGSIRDLFHDYEKIHPYLSMHAKVHPPGPIAILWLMSYVVGQSPMGLSIATILFGALSIVPMYWLASSVLGERGGQMATLLYSLMPTIVLFTATSADITFMPFTLMTLFLFWKAIHGLQGGYLIGITPGAYRLWKRIGSPSFGFFCAIAAGVFYGLLGLISFSLLSIGAFFGLVGLWRLFDARYRWAVVRTAIVMAMAAVAVHLLVYLWSGYNSIAVFELSKQQFDTDQANLDLMDPRWPAWAFKIVNPMCWFFFAGIPVSVLALRRMTSSFAPDRRVFLVIGLALLAFDILYLARGEGERSAMYIMPFIVLPAAHMLDEICAAAQSWRPLAITLACLGVQCIATEAILYTYW